MFAKFLFRTLYTEGFNRFVTSTIAPIATGWSDLGRAGFAPAGKQRLVTAHDKDGLVHRAVLAIPDIWVVYLIETAMMVSIGLTLVLLFAGSTG